MVSRCHNAVVWIPLVLMGPLVGLAASAQTCPPNQVDSDIRTFIAGTQPLSYSAIQTCQAEEQLIQAVESEPQEVRQIAIATLIEIFKQPQNSIDVRISAAKVLGQIGQHSPETIQTLLEILRADADFFIVNSAAKALGEIRKQAADTATNELLTIAQDVSVSPQFRGSAIAALAAVRQEQPQVVNGLMALLQSPQTPDDVSRAAAEALGQVWQQSPEIITALTDGLEHQNEVVASTAAEALQAIGQSLQDTLDELSLEQRTQYAEQLQTAANVAGKQPNIPLQQQSNLQAYVKAIKPQPRSVLPNFSELASIFSLVWCLHALIWLALIFRYAKSPRIQAIFFWNPWVRNVFGLAYVNLALTWIPFLRLKLFAPFRNYLVEEAHLDSLEQEAYFPDLTVVPASGEKAVSIQSAIPSLKGKILLVGESGLGKTMFLRNLVKSSQQLVVYLSAQSCAGGVIEAIQTLLHGAAQDRHFLQSLIYSGALDVCIDGLNEVSPDTRAEITNFIRQYSNVNLIVTTQPIDWQPPSGLVTYHLQPLNPQQIWQFLRSRQAILPENAPIRGQAYGQACKRYLQAILKPAKPSETQQLLQQVLSNPMDLEDVALMLAAGKTPDLLKLRQQQYATMAADFEHIYGPFPLADFAEMAYQMRLHDTRTIQPTEKQSWDKELPFLAAPKYKMVRRRQYKQALDPANTLTEWTFRHDKIQDFFIMQTFLGADNERPIAHIGDAQFRGVYFLLATLLPIETALTLRQRLMLQAAEIREHTVSDRFYELVEKRQDA